VCCRGVRGGSVPGRVDCGTFRCWAAPKNRAAAATTARGRRKGKKGAPSTLSLHSSASSSTRTLDGAMAPPSIAHKGGGARMTADDGAGLPPWAVGAGPRRSVAVAPGTTASVRSRQPAPLAPLARGKDAALGRVSESARGRSGSGRNSADA